jgi:hypothetical protein
MTEIDPQQPVDALRTSHSTLSLDAASAVRESTAQVRTFDY